MTLKNDGRISNKDKKKVHKKYRDIKCSNRDCRTIIDVDYAVSIGDIEYLDDSRTKGTVFCPVCGLDHLIELKK